MQRLLQASAMALVVITSVGSLLVTTADVAMAERGGNGNGGGNGGGNGNGNGNGNSRDREANGNNGRGGVASELKWLNSAHANQRARENASPNSRPGQLYAYQVAQGAVAEAENNAASAEAEFNRLVGLTEEEIATEFPDGGYEDAVNAAAVSLAEAQADASDAENEAAIILSGLTDGRTLSESALAELNRLLGL